MKKNILIVMPSLISGGTEVSLINFLNYLSKNNDINIDLCLFERKGIYYDSVPKNVNIIDVNYVDDIYSFHNKFSDLKKIKSSMKKVKFILFRAFLKLRLIFNDWEGYYKMFLNKIVSIDKEYDLAIDYLGYGHLTSAFVADRVTSKKKVMWIHDEKIDWLSRVNKWLINFDKFFCVSQAVKYAVSINKNEICNKLEVFYNLIDYNKIRNKSNDTLPINYCNDLNIVTVGRLENQKGYDIAIEIAKNINSKDIDFCWYVLGEGSLRDELKKLIDENNLSDRFKLLGNVGNPFPYIKNADLYIQPSRHEGYGLAIAEARVLGTIPISTNLECVKEQITDGVNGFLCNLDAREFADKIIEIINDKKLINKIKKNLEKESFDYTYEFEKIYKLMEE